MGARELRAVDPQDGAAASVSAAPEGSPNRLTIDELARETGLSVRNVRSHQARGLLPPPEVRGRIGYYGPAHADRLRLIQELQGEGLKLEGIKRLLDASEDSGERLLLVKHAADAPDQVETPEVLTAAELRERFDIEGDRAAKLLAQAVKLGVLEPLGGDHYEAPSPSLIEAAEEVVRRGITLEHALDLVAAITRHSTAVSREFVKLFLSDVWKPFSDAGMPEARWPEIADSIEHARPLAAQALLAVFRRTMSAEVEAAFADVARRLSEGRR